MSDIESEEDVYAWLIREDPEEARLCLCRECVSNYIGSGEPTPISEGVVGDTLYCAECGSDLGCRSAPQ